MTTGYPTLDGALAPVAYAGDRVDVLDQTRLPARAEVLRIATPGQMADAIRRLAVRGAPAIGIAAAYGIVLAAQESCAPEHIASAAQVLRAARPTAVNLGWALDRMLATFASHVDAEPAAIRAALLAEAQLIHREDVRGNRRIGELGAALLAQGARALTICNTGALATGGYGTALGVVRSAWAQRKIELVYVCETRPLLQGARLTAWELGHEGIPFRLVADSAAGALLALGGADVVLVGADRIARNGDTANKIGTYTLAVLAARHRVPFYVVAPTSTLDPDTPSGAEIPIEERDEREVLAFHGQPVAPPGARAWNPAFDVTPHELITAIVTERGVLSPPYDESIPAAVA
jgi:methylthioribose-1-phosphate isomerase